VHGAPRDLRPCPTRRSSDLNPPDIQALRQTLSRQFRGVILDDHRHWQQQIRTVTRSFALGGLAILLLVAAATTAIIISATRSAIDRKSTRLNSSHVKISYAV